MSESAEMWVEYGGRESIVETFVLSGEVYVRELWPEWEPRCHGTLWSEARYTVLDREVHWAAPSKEGL